MKFAVEMDRRSLPGLDRMKVIDAFALAVPQPPHTVDLKSPTKVIIVQVIRNSCTASVMDGDVYRKVKKCNIRMCSEQAADCDKDKEGGESLKNQKESAADKDQNEADRNTVSGSVPETIQGKRKRDVEDGADVPEATSKKLDTKSVHPG